MTNVYSAHEQKLQRDFLIAGRVEVPCHYCGLDIPAAKVTLEHIIPRSIARSPNRPENLALACARCNHLRNAMVQAILKNPRREIRGYPKCLRKDVERDKHGNWFFRAPWESRTRPLVNGARP